MLGRTSECPVHSPLGVGDESASLSRLFIFPPLSLRSIFLVFGLLESQNPDLGPRPIPSWLAAEQGHVSKPLPSQAGIMGGAPHSPWSSPRQLLPPPVPWVQRWGPKRPAPQTPGIRSALDQSRHCTWALPGKAASRWVGRVAAFGV